MKLSTISTIVIAALSSASPAQAKLRGLSSGLCTGQATGYQQCSADEASIVTCVNEMEISQPVAGGTKCCDDVINVGKVFMVFANSECYEPCFMAVEGQQICSSTQPDKYYVCTNGQVPGSLTAILMPMAGGTTCCQNSNDSTRIEAC